MLSDSGARLMAGCGRAYERISVYFRRKGRKCVAGGEKVFRFRRSSLGIFLKWSYPQYRAIRSRFRGCRGLEDAEVLYAEVF